MRLLPDGGLDPSFGRTGRVVYRLPKGGELTALDEDNKGRLLLAGRVDETLAAWILPLDLPRRADQAKWHD